MFQSFQNNTARAVLYNACTARAVLFIRESVTACNSNSDTNNTARAVLFIRESVTACNSNSDTNF